MMLVLPWVLRDSPGTRKAMPKPQPAGRPSRPWLPPEYARLTVRPTPSWMPRSATIAFDRVSEPVFDVTDSFAIEPLLKACEPWYALASAMNFSR